MPNQRKVSRQLLAYLLVVLAVGYALLQIHKLQLSLQSTQRQSDHTRVTTVSQRCGLTRLLYHSALRVDVLDANKYWMSLQGCQKQLKVVKKIAAHD